MITIKVIAKSSRPLTTTEETYLKMVRWTAMRVLNGKQAKREIGKVWLGKK